MIRSLAMICTAVLLSVSAFAQGGGGGGGGGGGSSGGGSASSGAAAASGSGANANSGTASNPTLSNTLRNARSTPGTQPNTYNALDQGSSANQMGTIGGSNSNGDGNAAPGSAVDNLTSTNTGVMAPSSNSAGRSNR